MPVMTETDDYQLDHPCNLSVNRKTGKLVVPVERFVSCTKCGAHDVLLAGSQRGQQTCASGCAK